MNASQLFSVAGSVLAIAIGSLGFAYSIGEVLAFYARFKRARAYEQWKRKMLRVPD